MISDKGYVWYLEQLTSSCTGKWNILEVVEATLAEFHFLSVSLWLDNFSTTSLLIDRFFYVKHKTLTLTFNGQTCFGLFIGSSTASHWGLKNVCTLSFIGLLVAVLACLKLVYFYFNRETFVKHIDKFGNVNFGLLTWLTIVPCNIL